VAREGGPASLSDAWRAWVAENALRSVPTEALLDTLVQNGVPERLGREEIEEIVGSPVFAGARRAANRALRSEMRARLERETARLARRPNTIERRSHLSPDEFVDRYYATGTPVIVDDTFKTWPALAQWSPSHFKERLPNAELVVLTDRADDPGCHAHVERASAVVPMHALCDRISTAGLTNDFYVISNDFDPPRGHLASLVTDISAAHPYLDDQRHAGCVLLWFGPAGTVTPLHHDTKNVWLCQVDGRKKVLLFPRFELPLLGALPDTVYGKLDLHRPEAEAFPELGDALRMEAELGPGDALFIPVGCFHQVRALEASISLGFSNFRAPNRFGWYTPGTIS